MILVFDTPPWEGDRGSYKYFKIGRDTVLTGMRLADFEKLKPLVVGKSKISHAFKTLKLRLRSTRYNNKMS